MWTKNIGKIIHGNMYAWCEACGKTGSGKKFHYNVMSGVDFAAQHCSSQGTQQRHKSQQRRQQQTVQRNKREDVRRQRERRNEEVRKEGKRMGERVKKRE